MYRPENRGLSEGGDDIKRSMDAIFGEDTRSDFERARDMEKIRREQGKRPEAVNWNEYVPEVAKEDANNEAYLKAQPRIQHEIDIQRQNQAQEMIDRVYAQQRRQEKRDAA